MSNSGTASGYHIYTYGWLVDQLIRRVDPKKRSIGEFVREELHDAHGVDMHVGLAKEEVARVARLTPPSIVDRYGSYSSFSIIGLPNNSHVFLRLLLL